MVLSRTLKLIERLSDLAFNLYTKNYIFNYATLFVQKNNSIPLPEKFQINDYIYNDFIDFLKNKDFDYKTKTEEHFNNLVNIAQKEKYFDIAENEFKALKDKIKHDKQKDLITFRPEIEKIIADEIIGRYYFQEGKIRYNIAYDKEIDTTIQVLCNKTKYLNILSGKENNVSQKDYSNENSDSEFDE